MPGAGSYFERGIREHYPDLEHIAVKPKEALRAKYGVTVVPDRFEARQVTIEIPLRGEPKVCVDGPDDDLPHRYPRNEEGCALLCMWFPEDPPEARWTRNDGLLALIGHIRTHLIREAFYMEDLRLHGAAQWLGPEAPHGSIPSWR